MREPITTPFCHPEGSGFIDPLSGFSCEELQTNSIPSTQAVIPTKEGSGQERSVHLFYRIARSLLRRDDSLGGERNIGSLTTSITQKGKTSLKGSGKQVFHFLVLLVLPALFSLPACTGTSAPLDAATRQRIDSTANAQIAVARRSLDSLCKVQRTTVLPGLVDSIMKVRQAEIERQLRTIPK